MKLYHVTTQKKAKQYRQSGAIHAPVRGFTTMLLKERNTKGTFGEKSCQITKLLLY